MNVQEIKKLVRNAYYSQSETADIIPRWYAQFQFHLDSLRIVVGSEEIAEMDDGLLALIHKVFALCDAPMSEASIRDRLLEIADGSESVTDERIRFAAFGTRVGDANGHAVCNCGCIITIKKL